MKKDILVLYAVVVLMTLINVSEINAVDRNMAYWRQKLVDASVPDLQKTFYADSILMSGVADSLDVTLTFAELLTKVGRYRRAAEVRKTMLRYDDTLLPEDKKLTIMAQLARDLINQEDFIGAINVCNKILQRSDPESGLQEEMEAYGVMHYILTRISHKDAHKYLERGNNLLEKARKANYSERELGELQGLVVRMRLSEHLSKKKFNEFFRLADSVMSQPMSNTQRLQLDLLWAYAKIVNGEDDLAMEKYKEIVGKPLWNVRQGEALLNLTYLLDKYKRYEEILDLIEAKGDIISMIPRPSYIYSALQANKAIAMNATGDTKEAFSIVQDACEEQSDLHYTSLALDATEALDNIDSVIMASSTHKRSDKRKEMTVWILSIVLVIITVLIIYFVFRFNHQKKQLGEANKLISELSSRHKEEINVHIERIKDQETTVTTNALQLARINETIELIRDLVKDKKVSDADKLKSISTSLATLAPQTELWEIFKINFEQVHSGFFLRLYGKHPDLTPIEARMCAYLAMNLSSKEIASLTNRSLRSVESIRYRLNRKIDLPKDMTLATYLRYFTVTQTNDSEGKNSNSPA